MREAVRGADECHVRQRRILELVTDAHEWTTRTERTPQQFEQRGALFEDLQQPAVVAEFATANVVEQPGGTADVEPSLVVRRIDERRTKGLQEDALLRHERVVVDALAERARTERQSGDAFVQILAGPLSEAGIDRTFERDDALRHSACRRDHDDHHDVGLQHQHLDVTDRRRLERRRGDEREQPRHLRQHFGRRLQRRIDLVPHGGQVEWKCARSRLEPLEHAAGEKAVAAFGRDAACRRVGMGQESQRLE